VKSNGKNINPLLFPFDDKKQLGVIFFNKSNEYTRKLNKSKQDLRKSQRSNQRLHLQNINAWNEQLPF
jgi:hypothetical protein